MVGRGRVAANSHAQEVLGDLVSEQVAVGILATFGCVKSRLL